MKTILLIGLGVGSCIVAAGCGPAAGTQPHAMSASQHEAAASQEQQAAESHGEQYDPEATVTKKKNCAVRAAGKYSEVPCWTSETNPTEEHTKDSKHHQDLAAQHRAASETLRTAEARACSGVPDEDRDMSPFAHREDIRSVSALEEELRLGKSVARRMAGAEIVFQAFPGMTAEWLQRVVDCHLARNAAIGHEAASAEMAHCPLTLRGAQATVRSVTGGFAVAIRADDSDVAKEILRRAESMKPSAAAQ